MIIQTGYLYHPMVFKRFILEMMNKGTKAFLFVPAELGYGAEESPQIPANSELIFYVELENIK